MTYFDSMRTGGGRFLINSKPEIKESFNWLTPEFKLASKTKKTAKIKGVALMSDVVSKNNRQYVEEELIKSARTLIGKPITINHSMERIVGNVDFAEFEDGKLEYIATIKKEPYVSLLQEGSPKITGVSIEAFYLDNVCKECGERFYTEKDYTNHMKEAHHIYTDPTLQPHGVHYTALSLVVAPEIPGVSGTTIELMEKADGNLRLFETVIKNRRDEKLKEQKIEVSPTVDPEEKEPDEPKAKDNMLPPSYTSKLSDTPSQISKVMEKLEELEEKIKSQKRDYQHILAAVNIKYGELKEEQVSLEALLLRQKTETRMAEQRAEIILEDKQALEKQLNETEDVKVRLDNLESKLKGSFKARSPSIEIENKLEKPIRDKMRTGS